MSGGVADLLHRLRRKRGVTGRRILFQRPAAPPMVSLVTRALLVVALFALACGVFWWDRAGLKDQIDGHVSFIDVIYFTVVTVTTVGYGDIVPVSHQARLIDALFVTPIRIFIWLIFLGSAYQLIFQRVIEDFRMSRLQRNLRDHVLIIGFGHRGNTAARELLASGMSADDIVVVDQSEKHIEDAISLGLTALQGNATSEELLRLAGGERARAVIVALDRDDTTVLTVLTLRLLNEHNRIVATVVEQENLGILKRSGASLVVSAAELGGYLLAGAVSSEAVAGAAIDLLSRGGTMALLERAALPAEVGQPMRLVRDMAVLSVRRDGRDLPFWECCEQVVRSGDLLLGVVRTPAA